MRKIILEAVLVGSLVAMGAGVASAQPGEGPDGSDYLFFAAMAEQDVHFLAEDLPQVARKGRAACGLLDTGIVPDGVVGIVFGSTQMDYRESMVLVAAAMLAYCPQHLPDDVVLQPQPGATSPRETRIYAR